MSFAGGCLCGENRFLVRHLPPHAYQCFCPPCRRRSGALGSSATLITKRELHWNNNGARRRFEGQHGLGMAFCVTCASPLPQPLDQAPYTWLPLGVMDDIHLPISISLHIHVQDAPFEVPMRANVERYQVMPDLPALISILLNPSTTRGIS